MKKIIIFGIITGFFIGCANTQPTIQKPKQAQNNDKNLKVIENFVKDSKSSDNIKKIAKYDDKVTDVKQAKKVLLKTNPLYAKVHKKEALKENMRLENNAPLYIPPRFAEMIVFPYTSDDGIYHDTQIVWVKIKDGQFVLNQKGQNEKERIFGINKGY
jgi:hypothetical protein